MIDDINILSELFKKKYGILPSSVVRLAGGGSGRRYYRLEVAGEESCIGVGGDSRRDCEAFIRLSATFRNAALPVPDVYEVSEDSLHYIQEDLGDRSLFSLIMEEGEEKVSEAVGEALRNLARMQTLPVQGWGKDVEYAPFSRRQIFWDLNYFKYEYLRPLGVDLDEDLLEDDFERFAVRLEEAAGVASGFMYRDFQSRNVMMKGERPFFIDYQGGRRGPSLYDAVSFLWQAKAGFSDSFRRRMLDIYAEEYAAIRGIGKETLLKDVGQFALFRTLQVLGAYGLRGLVEKKAHFIESIPGALANLSVLLDKGDLADYPELERVGRRIVADPRFLPAEKKGHLTVEVFSFSYKKGYPEDTSGNGGGFMFDCRGMHNPGRYPEYKTLTGMDKPVIDFLKEKGETDLFSKRAFELVEPTVERYIRRGFTNLQIGFGCTGGQHRSVYCAESVARMLAGRFPEAVIHLRHREQKVERIVG